MDGRDAPSRSGREAHDCHLSRGRGACHSIRVPTGRFHVAATTLRRFCVELSNVACVRVSRSVQLALFRRCPSASAVGASYTLSTTCDTSRDFARDSRRRSTESPGPRPTRRWVVS